MTFNKKYTIGFIASLLLLLPFNAKSIKPKKVYKARGNVTDIYYHSSQLYIASDAGTVEVFNSSTTEMINTIQVPLIKDFKNEKLTPKIYDIDFLSEQNKLLIVSQSYHGFSDLYIFLDTLIKIISNHEKLMIKKALFIDESTILLGLMSNEVVKYDIKNNTEIFRTQISPYTFSDMCLSKNKQKLLSTDESGRLNIINTNTGEVILHYEGVNLNNVYQIDFKGKTIVTAGQDRRLGIYHIKPQSETYIESQFLIYAVGLSPSGLLAAYSSNEVNDVEVINTGTKKIIDTLNAHTALLNHILFIGEKRLYTSADEKMVYYWELN